jgi:hypothetical protein
MYVEFDVYFVLYVILTIMVYLGKSSIADIPILSQF